MQKIFSLILFSFLFLNCFSQRSERRKIVQDSSEKSNSLIKLYYKIWHTELFTNFMSNHAPTIGIGIGSNGFKTAKDSTLIDFSSGYKDQLHILKFVGHPFFNDSIKGRLQMFTSVCPDGSCVREVSTKLYFDFDKEESMRIFLCSLIDSLNPLSEKRWYTKNEEIEKYEFASDLRPDRYEPEFMRYMQYVVLVLARSKEGGGFQLFIGNYYPEKD